MWALWLKLFGGDRAGLLPHLEANLPLVVGNRAERPRPGIGGQRGIRGEQVLDVMAGPLRVGPGQRVVAVHNPQPEGPGHDRRHVLGDQLLRVLEAGPGLVRHPLCGAAPAGVAVCGCGLLRLLHQGEQRGTLGHGQMRISQPGVQPEALPERLRDDRHDGHAADQKYVVEPFDALFPGRGERPLGDFHGPFKQFGRELFELLSGQLDLHHRTVEPHVVLARFGGAERPLEVFGRGRQVLHELLVVPRVELRVLVSETAQQEIGDRAVPVRSAQTIVTVCADNLDIVPVDADDRGVEGPAAEVVDEDVPHSRLLLEGLVGERGGHRFRQDIQNVQSRYLPGLAGGFALQHPEVRRNRDDHVMDLLAGLLARGPGQFPQDQRGDRLGGVVLPVVRVVHVLAHLALHQLGHQLGDEHGGVLGLLAHHDVLR